LNVDDVARYARQIALPEIGPEGQSRIGAARVVVVGGDLTAETATTYLRAAGVGNLFPVAAVRAEGQGAGADATNWRALDQAKANGVQYKVRFVYPADTKFAAEPAPAADEEVPAELSTAVTPDRDYYFNYEYSYKKKQPRWLIPASVYDDRRFTYIKMSDLTKFPTGNFPTVYMRQKEREEDSVVNTTVEGTTLVVHGTYPYLVIRHGDNVVGLRRNTAK
jgi:hypothetical protein